MPTEILKVREPHATVDLKPGPGTISTSLDEGAEVASVGNNPWHLLGEMLLYDTKHSLGNAYGAEWHHAFRFELPTTGWLAGKIIDNVSLNLTQTGAGLGSWTATAYMQKSATPAALADVSDNISDGATRPLTTANLAFGSGTVVSVSGGQQVKYHGDNTTEFKDLLNEVTGAIVPTSIDAIMIIIVHGLDGANGRRQIFAGGADPATRPELEILYRENVVDLDFKKREIVRLDSARVRI